MAEDLIIGRLVIPASELRWTAVRSSGPGGQNVNKVATKVRLRFDLARSTALPVPVKARLVALAANRIAADGALVLTSDRTRDQAKNLADARDKLARLVARALVPPKPRRATKPTRSAERRRIEQKRRAGTRKRERRGRGEE